MILIVNWLNGPRNFTVGKILYTRFGKDENLQKLFAKGETREAKKLLADALQALANADLQVSGSKMQGVKPAALPKPETSNQQPVTSNPQPVTSNPQPVTSNPQPATANPFRAFEKMPEASDPVLQSLQLEWKEKYAKMQYLRHSLDQYGVDNGPATIAACKPICQDILMIEQEVMAIWAKRDHYQQYGNLPEVKEEGFEIPTNPVELAKCITRLQRYVRRYKKLCVDEPGNALYASLLVKYTNQLNQVNGQKD